METSLLQSFLHLIEIFSNMPASSPSEMYYVIVNTLPANLYQLFPNVKLRFNSDSVAVEQSPLRSTFTFK